MDASSTSWKITGNLPRSFPWKLTWQATNKSPKMFNGKYTHLHSWWIFQQVIVSFRGGYRVYEDYEDALQSTARFFHKNSHNSLRLSTPLIKQLVSILDDFGSPNTVPAIWYQDLGSVLLPIALQHGLPLEGILGVHLFNHQTWSRKDTKTEPTKTSIALYCWFGHPRKPSSSHGGLVILYQFIPIQAGTLIPLWWVA